MNYNILTYAIYFLVILFVVLYVGAMLYHNGYYFVLNCFNGEVHIAKAVNKFLLVGYYLVNIGYSIIVLKGWERVTSWQNMWEVLGYRVGSIVLLLGVMHIINIVSLIGFGKRKQNHITTNINH